LVSRNDVTRVSPGSAVSRLGDRRADDALDGAGGQPLELHHPADGGTVQVDAVDVGVLGQARARLRRDDDGGVAAGHRRRKHADQPEQWRLLRRQHGDDAGGPTGPQGDRL
jgi:hypothetical protein